MNAKEALRPRGTVELIAVLAAVGFGLSACGGGSASPGVANLGSTTTTTQTSSSQTAGSGSTAAKYKAAFAYVDCMRSHGESNFPDPNSDGQINVKFASGVGLIRFDGQVSSVDYAA